jgi:signal transduction histidine kinase
VHVGISDDRDEGGKHTARISVRDNGPGIAPDFRERIFEEFFRVPSTDQTAPGSGLGLAISRRIARLLGGDITFSDAPEHGSIFTLVLPVIGPPWQSRNGDHGASREASLTLA